jgi:hypothetical protein
MATNQKPLIKARPTADPASIASQAEIARDYEGAPAEPASPAPEAAEHIVAEPIEVTAAAVSVTATSGPRAERSNGVFDLSVWPLKTLDVFNENAAAFLDFAAALGRAKSVGEAIEVQSRFASERYSALLQQNKELAELMRRFTLEAAPGRLNFSAFVA